MKHCGTRKIKHQWLIILTFVLSFLFIFPQSKTLAQIYVQNAALSQTKTVSEERSKQTNKSKQAVKRLPQNKIKIKKTIKVMVTAYNAVPEQTDTTPCITADGTDICTNPQLKIVAANWLPFGTKIRIPEYFGNTIFEVRDRMNSRYPYRLDVLMDSISAAKEFGIRYLKVEIIG